MKRNTTMLLWPAVLLAAALVLFLALSLKVSTTGVSPDSSKEECLRVARLCLDSDEPESAIYPLLLAIQKDEDDPQAHFLLAKVYHQTGVRHLGERECETSLALNPEGQEALGLLCRIKFEKGKSNWKDDDLPKAIGEFKFVVEKSDDSQLIDSIGYLTGGRFKTIRLTNDLFCDDAPSYSPDGTRIVYHSDTSYSLEDYGLDKVEVKRSRIFMMDADGKHKTCLSPQGEKETSERFARFSHGGRFVAYEKENSSARSGDTVFNSDRDIFIRDLQSGKVERLTDDVTYDGLPSFFPDDSEIIFVTDRPGARNSVCRLDLKSGDTRTLSLKKSWDEKIGLLRRAGGMILPYCPTFSPDGKSVLLHAGWGKRGIFLFDTESRSWKCLSDRNQDCFFPSFSPDGRTVVFVSGYPEKQDLYVIDANGSNQVRLTYDGGTKRYPSFSPDGNSIIFAGKRKQEPDNYFEIYLLQLDQTISRDQLRERLQDLEEAAGR